MTDGVIGALGRLGGVRVISRQSAMHYKNSTKKLPEIAEELGVDYLVEGSVARDGDSIRLQARLVRPQPEQQVWAEAYDRPSTRAISLHDSVAISVARAAGASIEPGEESRMSLAREVDPKVYEAHLQGRFFLDQGRPETLDKAAAFFESAMTLDPTFAPAFVGFAEVMMWKAYLFEDPVSLVNKAVSAAHQALALDQTQSGAYAVLGDSERYFRWDWRAAEEAYLRAIEGSPNDPRVRRKYWAHLASLGRHREARSQLDIARRLDPLSAAIETDFGLQDLFEGRGVDATRRFEKALELDPSNPYSHAGIWIICHEAGRAQECWAPLRAWLAGIGLADLADAGVVPATAAEYKQRLSSIASQLESEASVRRVQVGTGGALFAAAGELDRAEEWLIRAYEERSPEMVWLGQSPSWVELRKRPAVRRILSELNLPYRQDER
jgi:tetratricopeptide (TPR) repeat protein